LAEITENWHGFGKNQDIKPFEKPFEKEKRKRMTKYMECTPEIEKMLNKKLEYSSFKWKYNILFTGISKKIYGP